MIAAAARRSGTRSPFASTLYRGSTVAAISRAVATARACASLVLRVCDRAAEYAVGFFADERFAEVSRVCASAGTDAKLIRQQSARGPAQNFRVLLTRIPRTIQLAGSAWPV